MSNVACLHRSHVQTAQDVCDLLNGPVSNHPMLNSGDNLSSRNRDIVQNVILAFYDLETSRLSVKVNKVSFRPLPLTHKYTCEVSLRSYRHLFRFSRTIVLPKACQGKEERRQEKQTDVC